MNKGFKKAFYSLPHNQLKEVEEEICKEMGWPHSTFVSKRNGSRPLKRPEAVLLKEILHRHSIQFNI